LLDVFAFYSAMTNNVPFAAAAAPAAFNRIQIVAIVSIRTTTTINNQHEIGIKTNI
jgi:hypothetical protein